MIKISVIVPVYNVEKYLRQCIESLCAQTLTEIEIILVNDGSSDNSGKICDEYSAKDKRIKVIHKKNEGVSAARNDGIKASSGNYLIFVDSDDYIPKDAYEKLYNKAHESDADIVMGDLIMVKGEKQEYVQFFDREYVTTDRAYMDQLIQAAMYNTYCPNPAQSGPAYGYGGPTTKLVRKSLLLENDIWFDVSVKGIFDDVIYTAYIFAVAHKIAYITSPIYYYRAVDTSLTRTYKANMLEINGAIFKSWNVFMEKHKKKDALEELYYANILRRIEHTMNNYFFSTENPKTLKSVIKEMKETFKEEPYASAIKRVKISKLSKNHKKLSYVLKTKSSLLCLGYYWAKTQKRKMLRG